MAQCHKSVIVICSKNGAVWQRDLEVLEESDVKLTVKLTKNRMNSDGIVFPHAIYLGDETPGRVFKDREAEKQLRNKDKTTDNLNTSK